jgi:hypothetical protein
MGEVYYGLRLYSRLLAGAYDAIYSRIFTQRRGVAKDAKGKKEGRFVVC